MYEAKNVFVEDVDPIRVHYSRVKLVPSRYYFRPHFFTRAGDSHLVLRSDHLFLLYSSVAFIRNTEKSGVAIFRFSRSFVARTLGVEKKSFA